MLADIVNGLSRLECEGYRVVAPGLTLGRSAEPHGIQALIYEPLVCLILQGAKETRVGSRTVRVEAGQTVIVSHDLPVLARVVEASAERPYTALIAALDLAELRTLQGELQPDELDTRTPSALAVDRADPATLATFARYASLAHDPVEARVLAPLVRKELHFRLLRASHGGMLRALAAGNNHARRIARAIQTLRTRYRDRLEVTALARSVGMSDSSFYKEFKAITSTTPLQYQKDLRLSEARRLLLGGEHSVSTAAFEVGYESPSQFSREYARKFGASPRHDLAG